MTGYLETLSDPSYYGQIVVQTFPLIGNYGVIPADLEMPPAVAEGLLLSVNGVTVPPISAAKGALTPFLKLKACRVYTAWTPAASPGSSGSTAP